MPRVNGYSFARALASAREVSPDVEAFTDSLTADVLEPGARYYLHPDGCSGFALVPVPAWDGFEVRYVFSVVPGRGRALALAIGSETAPLQLYCIGDYLRSLYERVGFVVTDTYAWSDDEWTGTPEGRARVFAKAGERPNVYFMTRDGTPEAE